MFSAGQAFNYARPGRYLDVDQRGAMAAHQIPDPSDETGLRLAEMLCSHEITPIQNVTPSQPAENCDKSAYSIRHKLADVTFRYSPERQGFCGL